MRRRVLATLMLFSACSPCGKTPVSQRDLARVLPADAAGVLLIPDLERLSAKLKMLAEINAVSTVLALQGLPPAAEYLSEVMAQIGVDFRSPSAIESAGIDPQGGLGLAVTDAHHGYAVLGIKDERRFRTTAEGLARRQFGAQAHQTKLGAYTVTSFPRGDLGPVAAFLLTGGYAYLALGDAAHLLVDAASLSPTKALAKDPAFAASRDRLPADRDLLIHLSARVLGLAQGPSGPITFAMSLSKGLLKIDASIPWEGVSQAASGKPGSQPKLLHFLPPDAFFVARLKAPPKAVDSLLKPWFPPDFDFRTEVFGNLKSEVLVAISLAPKATLESIMALDPRRVAPFRTLHVVGIAEVNNADAAFRVLDRLPILAAGFHATITPIQREGKKLYLGSYARGEGLSFALAGDKWVVAAPVEALEETLAKVERGSSEGNSLEKILPPDESSSVAAIDLRQLSLSLRNLPSSAWGVGGFAIKKSVENWLDALSELELISLSFSTQERAIEAQFTLRFQAR